MKILAGSRLHSKRGRLNDSRFVDTVVSHVAKAIGSPLRMQASDDGVFLDLYYTQRHLPVDFTNAHLVRSIQALDKLQVEMRLDVEGTGFVITLHDRT